MPINVEDESWHYADYNTEAWEAALNSIIGGIVGFVEAGVKREYVEELCNLLVRSVLECKC